MSRSLVEWAVAEKPLAGQGRSGDRYLVKASGQGVLIAVVDGLGHGVEAAFAADRALETVEGLADEPLVSLFERCHQRLTATRGAVMSVARVEARAPTMTWLGVGNVDGVLVRVHQGGEPSRVALPVRGGILGDKVPPMRVSVFSIGKGDMLVMATDGLDASFAQGLRPCSPPRQAADRILVQHGRGTDDALVLVARYTGLDDDGEAYRRGPVR